MAWRDRDHTRGSLLTSLGVLALPLVAQSSGQVVFQLVDLGFVTRLGEDATTAVVVTNQSSWTIYRLYMSPSSQTTWGPDQLGSEVISTGGDSFTLNGIPFTGYTDDGLKKSTPI